MRAAHQLTDRQLADLARSSFVASRAPEGDKTRWLDQIDDWLGTMGS
jgi:adenosine deaminase